MSDGTGSSSFNFVGWKAAFFAAGFLIETFFFATIFFADFLVFEVAMLACLLADWVVFLLCIVTFYASLY